MFPSFNRHSLMACLLLMVVASVAEAQGVAGSFEQLRLLVRPGDTIAVTESTGTPEITGRIVDLSPTSLSLLVRGTRRDFKEAEVTRIRQRRQDPLGNGALWGLGIGAGLGGTAAFIVAATEEETGWALLAAAFYAGIGAGIGVGIDALITRPQVIYSPVTRSSHRIHVSPILKRAAHGALVSLRF